MLSSGSLEMYSTEGRNDAEDTCKTEQDSLVDVEKYLRVDEHLIMRMNHPFRLLWDLLIMILSLFVGLELPVQLAFRPNFMQEAWFNYGVHLTLFLIFIMDIALNFRTTFINSESGEEVYSAKKIAYNYLTGMFVIDLISLNFAQFFVESIEDETTADLLGLLGLLRLIHIGRVSKIITYMNARVKYKLALRLSVVILMLILYVHTIGCVWYYLA